MSECPHKSDIEERLIQKQILGRFGYSWLAHRTPAVRSVRILGDQEYEFPGVDGPHTADGQPVTDDATITVC